jgi:hypothetical protein
MVLKSHSRFTNATFVPFAAREAARYAKTRDWRRSVSG